MCVEPEAFSEEYEDLRNVEIAETERLFGLSRVEAIEYLSAERPDPTDAEMEKLIAWFERNRPTRP